MLRLSVRVSRCSYRVSVVSESCLSSRPGRCSKHTINWSSISINSSVALLALVIVCTRNTVLLRKKRFRNGVINFNKSKNRIDYSFFVTCVLEYGAGHDPEGVGSGSGEG